MNWPWVSRLAYENVRDERDRLREQNDTLVEHLTRVQRRESGMPEMPREKPKPVEPVPQSIRRLLDGFSPQVKKQLELEARQEHTAGVDWSHIQRQIEEMVAG